MATLHGQVWQVKVASKQREIEALLKLVWGGSPHSSFQAQVHNFYPVESKQAWTPFVTDTLAY